MQHNDILEDEGVAEGMEGVAHVFLFSPLLLLLCYYQLIIQKILNIFIYCENCTCTRLCWEIAFGCTCDVIFLRTHVCAKKMHVLFFFKIKIYLFWIEKRFLKNFNEFFHFLCRLRLEDNLTRFPSFYYISLHYIC